MMTTLELEKERKKMVSLMGRKTEIHRKLELIDFRLSVLDRVRGRFCSDFAVYEYEVITKMKDELEKELKEVKEKIQSCKVDALGLENLEVYMEHMPTYLLFFPIPCYRLT